MPTAHSGFERLYYVPCPGECGRERVRVDVDSLGRAGVLCPQHGFLFIPQRAATDLDENEKGKERPGRRRLCLFRKKRKPRAVVVVEGEDADA